MFCNSHSTEDETLGTSLLALLKGENLDHSRVYSSVPPIEEKNINES